jgi:hypothetical protein
LPPHRKNSISKKLNITQKINYMKSHFFLLFPFVLFTACQPSGEQTGESSNQPTTTSASETTEADSNWQGVMKGDIYIERLTDYSPQFIASIQNAAKDIVVVSMLGDRLVTKGGDTLHFPKTPPIGSELVFTGGEPGQEVELRVERVNQSTIRYGMVVQLAEGGTYEMKSLADLAPLFFLGAESDEDEQTGLSYFASEYVDPTSECNNSIRIGQADDGGPYLAKLVMDCPYLPMSMEESPTLRTK